jgi:hypothetical protein
MSNLGIGVLISRMTGNKETVEAVKSSLGKRIQNVNLEDNRLVFSFVDGSQLAIWDDGQSCCEHRYMATSDKLEQFHGADLVDFEIKTVPNADHEWGEHEIQFLDVRTSVGVFQIANHNEHNGYYGGFSLKASATGGAQ